MERINYSSREIEASDSRITAIAVSPDGEMLASGDECNKLKLWSIKSEALIKEIKVHPVFNQYCGISPDGSLVVSYWGDDRRIRIWSSETGELINDLGDETNGMNFIGISPDNAVAALASEGREAQFYLWSIETGKQHLKLKNIPNIQIKGTGLSEKYCGFTSDNSRFFVNSDRKLHLWDANSGVNICSLDEIKESIFSPNSKYVALRKMRTSTSEIFIYSLENNELHSKFRLPVNQGFVEARFSLDSRKLIVYASRGVYSSQKYSFVYDLATQELLQSNDDDSRKEISLDDELYILSDSYTPENDIGLWSVETGELVKKIEIETRYRNAVISNDGKYLAAMEHSGLPAELHLFSVATGKLIRNFGEVNWESSRIVFSKDGKRIILCPYSYRYYPRTDNVIYSFTIDESGSTKIFDSNVKGINSVSFSPDGKFIASVGNDGIIRLSSVESCELIQEISMDDIGIIKAKYSPAGDLIASHNRKNDICLWSVENGELVRTVDSHSESISPSSGNRRGIAAIDFSPDGKYIAACFQEYGIVSCHGDGKGEVKIWDVESGELFKQFGGRISSTKCVAYSSDGKYVATTGGHTPGNVWSIDTGEMKRGEGLGGHNFFLDTSYDGRWIASMDSDSIFFRDSKTGKVEYCICKYDDIFTSLAFSPTRNDCYTGNRFGLIEFWRIYDK